MRQDFYEEYSHIEREHWWFLGRRKIILTVLDRFFSPDPLDTAPGKSASVETATESHIDRKKKSPSRLTASQKVSGTDLNPLLTSPDLGGGKETSVSAAYSPPSGPRSRGRVGEIQRGLKTARRRVLDVGIGSGVMLPFLERYGEVFGCDRESSALFFSRESAHGRLIQGEAGCLPVADESLDLVTLFDLLEHTQDDESVLVESARVLRPGGYLCVTVPAHPWLWGNQDLISRHVRRYRTGELERRIESAGLGLVYRTYFNTVLFPVVALIRLARRLSGRQVDEDTVRSDFTMTKPGRLNDLLKLIFSAEARWLQCWKLPVGVSLLCVARKS